MKRQDDRGPTGGDTTFDRAMRDLHAQALAQVSPHTRTRLRAARTSASDRAPARGLRWVLATGLVALVALAIGLPQWREPHSSANAPTRTAAVGSADYGVVATLDENPDLYLWLASNDESLSVTSER